MNSSGYNLLDTPKNRKDFYLVISVATMMFALSCLGALYVLYRTYTQWNFSNDSMLFKKRSLNMNYKLPFYTSCIGGLLIKIDN